MNGPRIQIPGIGGMQAGPSPIELAKMEVKQVMWNLYLQALNKGMPALEAIEWAKLASAVWVEELKNL